MQLQHVHYVVVADNLEVAIDGKDCWFRPASLACRMLLIKMATVVIYSFDACAGAH